jgi:hypothetical protein
MDDVEGASRKAVGRLAALVHKVNGTLDEHAWRAVSRAFWRPISTAPRDRIIWVANENSIRLAEWFSPGRRWVDAVLGMEPTWKGRTDILFEPTHWAPIPEPPHN